MFTIPGSTERMKTWNVWVGCRHDCTYCSAARLAATRLKHIPRYEEGFKPHLVEKEMGKKFHPGDFVFCAYMGDISFAHREVVRAILENISRQPEVRFLFCTKNPLVYWDWQLTYPPNLYLGATIESNIDHGVSKAPSSFSRYRAMKVLDHPHKFVSIEPLLDFHVGTMVDWMKEIGPELIEVGADNYNNGLCEPMAWKVSWLLEILREFCPTVVEKQGLERLL